MIPTASEQRFEGLLESAPDGIIIVDACGTIEIVNGQAESLSGYRRSELIGESVEVLIPERLHDAHRGLRQGYADEPRTRPMGARLELWLRRKDGSELPVEISLSPLSTEEGLLITAVIRDVSGRQKLEEAQRRALEADIKLQAERVEGHLRREVLHRSIRAQEEERRRIARELHDETAQALTGLSLGLGRIETATDLAEARAEATKLGRDVVEAMRELRRMAMRLRPSTLDGLGLISALEQLAKSDSSETSAAFSHPGFDRRLDPSLETTIYRVAQEALANVAKHAESSETAIEIVEEGGEVILTVSDNGRGFDPADASGGRLGLGGMRERAALVGGELTIESRPERGTTVRLRAPVGES